MYTDNDLAPVIACEQTVAGWRGLTEDGEILNVSTANGIPVGDRIAVAREGKTIGYRHLPKQLSAGRIDLYQEHFDRSLLLLRANETESALSEIDAAIQVANTHRARHNRSLILLALGRWHEGLDEFVASETSSEIFMRPRYRAALEFGLHLWQGEDIKGKRLLLIHDHGFGDSIMMLRYVPKLKAMGAKVVLVLPPELHRLGRQCAPVTHELVDADYFCSLLMLLHVLKQQPQDIPTAPYLKAEEFRRIKWRQRIGTKMRKRIGIAWSVGVPHDGDYPRACPRELFELLRDEGAELYPVQQNDELKFEDFADCAALMSLMDEIVTIDTAAVHLAGAIGHPHITLLLSHWASWRWLSPLYENLTFCRQQSPGEWASAFAQRSAN